MDDLEATRLCAEAMSYDEFSVLTSGGLWLERDAGIGTSIYDPLHDDAQCLALVKRFGMTVCRTNSVYGNWRARVWYEGKTGQLCEEADSDDLNRAIVYCVAAMQQAKGSAKG